MALDSITNRDVVEGISVTHEEAAKVNLTSKILLKSGDKAIIVGYFHNLHCLVGCELTQSVLKFLLTTMI